MLKALNTIVPSEELLGIVNTGDDLTMHGLRICPDLDTIMYTLAGLNNEETGWGLTGETWRVMAELDRLGGDAWFQLGDRDLATHLYRTSRLAKGATLSEVTHELTERLGCPIRLLPVTEDPLATLFETADYGTVSFQEYFVRHHHDITVRDVIIEGALDAQPSPGVLDAIASAERIVISPSNPLISIAPLLAVPGVREALTARRGDVVAVSPLIGGKALKGPADRLLRELGHEVSPLGIAALYADIVGTFVIDTIDANAATGFDALDMRVLATGTLMSDPEQAATLAQVVRHG